MKDGKTIMDLEEVEKYIDNHCRKYNSNLKWSVDPKTWEFTFWKPLRCHLRQSDPSSDNWIFTKEIIDKELWLISQILAHQAINEADYS